MTTRSASTTESALTTESVCVLGAGPAGCAAAITLARSGVAVQLWADPAEHRGTVGECLSPGGPALLGQLGAWSGFLAQGHLACPAQVSVWGDDTPTWRDFLSDPRGTAWHVDRLLLNDLLRRTAVAAGVTLVPARAPRTWRHDAGRWTSAGGPRRVAVVDATGRSAVFARSAGARSITIWDQVALVGVGRHDAVDQPGPGLTEAVQSGFWYTAPVPGKRWMAAHFMQAAALDRSALGTAAGWQIHLDATRHLRASLPPGLVWDKPRVHAAGTRLLAPAAGPGWVAVGDAAVSWDPISAHGLTLALRTGIDGANALLHDLNGDPAPGEEYTERLASATRRFTAEVQGLWAQERRWPDSEYWTWRHVPLASPGLEPPRIRPATRPPPLR